MAANPGRTHQNPEGHEPSTVESYEFADDIIEGDSIVPFSNGYRQGLEFTSFGEACVIPRDAAILQVDHVRAVVPLQNVQPSHGTTSVVNHGNHPAPFEEVSRDVGDNNGPDAPSPYSYTSSSVHSNDSESQGGMAPKRPSQGDPAPKELNPGSLTPKGLDQRGQTPKEPGQDDATPKELDQGNPVAKEPGQENLETSSLMLVCFRSWASAPRSRKITVGRPTNPEDREGFERAVNNWNEEKKEEIKSGKRDPLIISSGDVVRGIRKGYQRHLRGIWRRIFSLKTVRSIRLRAVKGKKHRRRPAIVKNMSPEATADLLFQIFRLGYGSTHKDGDDWVEWVFGLSDADGKRHQLEFIEGWSPLRLLIATSIPLLSSIVLGVCWIVLTGDIQTGFTLAGFVLTAGSGEC
ncbi:hypothetical protein ACJ41O_010401 [Fusarium nematophilum]